MTRYVPSPACTIDPLCYRNDGHAGEHAYATDPPERQPGWARDWSVSQLASLLSLWYRDHGGPTPLYRMEEQAAWLVDAGVAVRHCQELRLAAEQLVQLGNQPGMDDDEWEDAFSALEQAVGATRSGGVT